VGAVRGDEGFHHYGPYNAEELARHASLEDVWHLLVEGHLPSPGERAAFGAEVAEARVVPADLAELLPAIARGARGPLDAFRAALALVPARPLMDLTPAERRTDAVRVAALSPVLLAAVHRLGAGEAPLLDWGDRPWAEAYLHAVTGAPARPEHVRAVEAYLISTLDHGLNASTFTARVVASTGADLPSAVSAGVGALSGPRHGGAPSRALELLEEIAAAETRSGSTRAATDQVVRAKLAAGERIMGFGHAVYRSVDPRTDLLRSIALDLGGPQAARAAVVEARVVELLAEHRPDRVLPANVELYTGVVLDACGIPRSMFTPTFTSSRIVAWCAHALEQAATGVLIRPAARYTGPPVDPVAGARVA
jgi:citrate synthase